ncbi:MAG TPA: hypothetical protein VKZ95_04365, partial [Sphingobacteriaceae bacterium]|nr:hypothetical protein [Sphingobacteriaceae bacterium]
LLALCLLTSSLTFANTATETMQVDSNGVVTSIDVGKATGSSRPAPRLYNSMRPSEAELGNPPPGR